jgi:hypothetical protein
MRTICVLLLVLTLPALAGGPGVLGANQPAAPGVTSPGRVYHLEYLRARPGLGDDYDHFVQTVFRPMLEDMVGRGVWLRYRFMTVPYAGASPCADYTHVFVAELRNFAALDREVEVWGEVMKKFHPDEGERQQLFEMELPRLREMVREEFLKDFEWK